MAEARLDQATDQATDQVTDLTALHEQHTKEQQRRLFPERADWRFFLFGLEEEILSAKPEKFTRKVSVSKDKLKIRVETDLENWQETYAEFDKSKLSQDKIDEIVEIQKKQEGTLPNRIIKAKRIQSKWEK